MLLPTLLPHAACPRRVDRRRASQRAAAAAAERAADPRLADPAYAEFASLLGNYDFSYRVGDRVTGTVIGVQNKGISVDIGAKSAAFCPTAEFSMGKIARVRSGRRAAGVRGPKQLSRPGW